MATTKQDIAEWFDYGITINSEFMIIVCDTFDYTDYPVYCAKDNYKAEYKAHSTNMQKVMEVYNLTMDKNSQVNQQFKSWNTPENSKIEPRSKLVIWLRN